MKQVVKVVALIGALGVAFLLGQSTSNLDKWWTPENDALAAAPQNHGICWPFLLSRRIRSLDKRAATASLTRWIFHL